MKKVMILSSLLLLANGATITELFNAIEKTPDYKLDSIAKKEMKINKNSVVSSLYPKLTLQASAEHFNRYNSIVPLTPTQSAELTKTNGDIPFSQNIQRIGFEISMPLFIKSIYDNKNKMTYLVNATNYQTKINLYKKQTLLVGYLSKFDYLFALKKALLKQQNSIQTTYDGMKKGVKIGRIPEFKLLRLQDSLNQIKIKLSSVNQNIDEVKASILKVTNIELDSPISFDSMPIENGEFIALKPLKETLKANEYGLKAKKDNNYPKVIIKIQGNRAYAKAYNTDNDISEDFASAGIYLSWDIFNKKNNSDIQKSKIELIKNKLEIAKTKKDLMADVVKIDKSLKEIERQVLITKDSIKVKEELLKGAKVAFKLNRMTVDEYLKYEDDLARIRADFANLIANKNMLKAQKALIYGKNLKKVFK